MNSFRFSGLFVVVFNCILVCLIVFIIFNQLFLLFLFQAIVHLTLTQTLRLQALIQSMRNLILVFDQTPPFCYKRPSLQKVLKDIFRADSDFKTILAFKAKKKKPTTNKQQKRKKKHENTREKGAGNQSKHFFFDIFCKKKKSELADGKRQSVLKWPTHAYFCAMLLLIH